MGCNQSIAIEPGKDEKRSSSRSGSTRSSIGSDSGSVRRDTSRMSTISSASTISEEQHKAIHSRLRKLQELDDTTKIPFILVELRGHGHKDGYVEICGKDEYGVYDALDQWLVKSWSCKKLDAGDLSDDTPVPFCDAMYRWEGFLAEGSDGTSNMGLATMRLVDFMCNELNWTLGVINGGNVGKEGEIREQQVIFKAPHPMNRVAPLLMCELRSVGYIEVCGTAREPLDRLHQYFVESLGAHPCPGHEAFCDRLYRCNEGVFKERGNSGENNMGLLTAKVCDAVVNNLPGWSLVTMNGGNYGENGCHREQQLVFRWDNHPLREAPHVLCELREAGYVEINGQNIDGIHEKLEAWLQSKWGCQPKPQARFQDNFCDKKLTWRPKDMMVASAEITGFFHELGWQMQVCSQGTVAVKGNSQSREQQILFRPGASKGGFVEPHLFIELYTGEGEEELYARPEVTQVLGKQRIRVREVGDCTSAVRELSKFVSDYLGGFPVEGSEVTTFDCDIFLSRGLTDNNLGCWTMRLCDFMVDRLGWSFVVCNICNLGPAGQFREQQLVFRFDGERRNIPPVKQENAVIDWTLFPGLEFPNYWQSKEVLNLQRPTATVSCNNDEIQAIQEVFDATFKRILTRDRVYEYQLGVQEEMPYRLEVVHAFRSEHAELYRRYAERRAEAPKGGNRSADAFAVKTQSAGRCINDRLTAGEALLAHGTNPSSAMGILKTGFVLNHAGKTTGTMFGFGVYLAECVSKSDEYARDESSGGFPGLMAILLCRCYVGRPHVVNDAGDHIGSARAAKCDCLCGDREAKVGTYREFVFWDERQVYPEYAVIYRRQYQSTKVPQLMRQRTFGTTGRSWQVSLEKGWANIPPDVSFALTQAQQEGKTTLEYKIADEDYHFDLAKMQQTNLSTSRVRKLRPPMRK